jgi:hypothetical protein
MLPPEAQRFLKLLDPAAELFTFQTFQDRTTGAPITRPELARVLHDDRELMPLNAAGAGVYVTVNRTDLAGRKSENIIAVRAVWQEADDGYDGPFPLQPSIEVESSPGRFHRYWLALDWPADAQGRANHAAVMERMIADYGSCPGAKDIARVLRLPGFLHQKGSPRFVRIVSAPGRRYTYMQILRVFPPLPHNNPRLPRRGSHARMTMRALSTRCNPSVPMTAPHGSRSAWPCTITWAIAAENYGKAGHKHQTNMTLVTANASGNHSKNRA